jgi:hypothetical protein
VFLVAASTFFFEWDLVPSADAFKAGVGGVHSFCASLSLMLETINVRAQERISPDKKWEYQYSEGVGPQIVKAGTTEVVLDLSDALPSENNGLTTNKEAEPVWAPDSKRVAFNYILHEHRSDGWGTTMLFELRNDKWVFLRSPVDSKAVQAPDPNFSNRDQLAQLAKKYLPTHSYNRAILKSPSTGDFLKVVSWTDSDTAVFWAFSSEVARTIVLRSRTTNHESPFDAPNAS